MDGHPSDYDAPLYLDRRREDWCGECGQFRKLNPIYDSHSADVIAKLCDECLEARQRRLEAMYRGD